jgi:aminopeptidase N
MVRALKASLDYYTTNFGPYQYPELRIVEVPPYGVRGRALATTILFAEDFFLTRAREGKFDQAFFGTAHEVAHSWWGGQLRGAHVRGRAMLSEALANYSAMLVTEQTFGPEAARQVYDYQMDRYLSRRSAFATDVPLIDAEDHPHVSYGKGAVAMYALREHIGDETVNRALRGFLEKHRDGPPYPTSVDLVAELRAATPDSLRYLLTDFFETVTLWELKAEPAVVERTAAGEYVVTFDVVAKKMRADSIGRETEVPMNDQVEIGIFAPGTGDSRGTALYMKRHRIRSGRQTISVTLSQVPARAGIDPHGKLIERERADNLVEVNGAAANPGGSDA